MGKKYILSSDFCEQLINFVISQDQKIPEDWKEIDGTDIIFNDPDLFHR